MDDCLFAVASCYYSLGKYHEALQFCEQVMRRNPDHRYANQLHVYILEAQGKYYIRIS